MPENTVYVGRPTRWGNPFIDSNASVAVAMFIQSNPVGLNELRGKNLACWCKLDSLCHADVLLELANKEDNPI